MRSDEDSGKLSKLIFPTSSLSIRDKVVAYGRVRYETQSGNLVFEPVRVRFDNIRASEFNAIEISLPGSQKPEWSIEIKMRSAADSNWVNQMLDVSPYQVPLTIPHTGQSFGRIRTSLIELLNAIQHGVDQHYAKHLLQAEQQRIEAEASGQKLSPDYSPLFWHSTHSMSKAIEQVQSFSELDNYTPKL